MGDSSTEVLATIAKVREIKVSDLQHEFLLCDRQPSSAACII